MNDTIDNARTISASRAWWSAMLCLTLAYLVAIVLRPLSIPDEPRYGALAREMLASGNWIVPHIDGVRYFEKPPLHSWLTAIAQACFGTTEFAVRLTSLLSVVAVGWMLVISPRRAGIPARSDAGRWAAALWMSSIFVFFVGSIGIIDPLFSMLLTGSLLQLHAWSAAADRGAAKRALLCCGLFTGAAFLAKGLVAFAVPGIVAIVFLSLERRWRDFVRDSWIPFVALSIVVAPWSIAIALQESDFWRYFFVEEHLKRFSGNGAHHAEPVWFYFPLLIGGLVPWTFVLPAVSIRDRVPRRRSTPSTHSFVNFLWIWILGGLCFFSASRGKLPTYVLPLMPPIALLIALELPSALHNDRRRWFDLGAMVLAILIGLAGLAVPVMQLTGTRPPFGVHDRSSAVVLTIALIAWSVATMLARRSNSPERKLAWFAIGPVGLMIASGFAIPTRTLEKKMPGRVLVQALNRFRPGDRLVSDSNLVHAVSWEFERSDVFVFGPRSELTYGLSYADARQRAVDANALLNLLEARTPGQAVFVFRKLYDPPIAGEFGELPSWELRFGSFLAQEFRRMPGVSQGTAAAKDDDRDNRMADCALARAHDRARWRQP